MKKRYKRKKKNRISLTGLTTGLSIIVAIISFLTVRLQIANLEKGILEVCAEQQDAYVELVLSQISIKENRTNEEIIEKILQTLDASSNKYWTLSENQELLFVKDVTETNKFKGLTTGSYYISDSAQTFLKELTQNKVIHEVITVGDRQYIASGVIFTYAHKEYKLCLLTNREVLLDNNRFLGAKIQILAVMVIIDSLFVITAAGLCYYIEKIKRGKEKVEDLLADTQLRFVALNDKMQKKSLHDTRNDVWEKEALPDFLDRLQKKKIVPVTIAQVDADSEDNQKLFLANCQNMLDKNVLRFKLNAHSVIILFIQADETAARWNLVPLIEEGLWIVTMFTVEDAEELSVQLLEKRLGIGAKEIYAD